MINNRGDFWRLERYLEIIIRASFVDIFNTHVFYVDFYYS